MKKFKKVLTIAISCGVIAVALCGIVLADPVISAGQPMEDNSQGGPGASAPAEDDGSGWATAIVISGPVLQVNDDYILIDSVSDNEDGPVGMVSMRTDPDLTLIVSAADGYPASLSDIKEGETIYAYVGTAMTLSLPPQISASMIICDVPSGGIVPAFIKVVSLAGNEDGTYKLTVAGGDVYTLGADCAISPFRTRNIVTFSDLTPGANCLIWADAENNASKIVIVQQ